MSSVTNNHKLIVDAHEDLAFNAQSHGRDLLKPAVDRRKLEKQDNERGGATTSFPDLVNGNIRVVFGTLWVNPCSSEFAEKPCYTNSKEAYLQAHNQLDYYKQLERQGVITIIKTRSQLEDIVSSKEPKIGVVVLMEGSDPVRAPKEAKEWFDDGLRIIGLAWGATKYSGGTKAPGPLTKEGHELLKEMDRAGFILDCSHFAEESFYEALDDFEGPTIVSHANSRIYCPTDRHLSDEMIKAVTGKDGGVIGTVLYNGFLDGNWKKGNPKSGVTLSQVVKNILHVCEVSGSKTHSGIGSDFDGGFGYESIPLELDTSADLYKIGDALKSQAKYTDKEASDVLGGNFLRVLRSALPD